MGLHIDEVRAPRGRLSEKDGGSLALVGIHPDFDLPEGAQPLRPVPVTPDDTGAPPAAAVKKTPTHRPRAARKP